MVAFGTDGTGHVAWQVTGSDTKVGYLPRERAGRRVQPLRDPELPGFRWTSADNGQSFGAAAEVGRGVTTGGFGTLLDNESFVGVERSEAKAADLAGTAGRMHLAWRSLHDGGRLRYSVSDTAGNNFTAAANLAARDSFVEPELGAGGDGRGFVTWTSSGAVRVVALDPQAEAAAPPGAPAPAPADPATPPVSGAGTTYSGPTRARVTRVPGASITFIAPRGCVAPGQRFRVRLVWKRQRRKGNLFVKIFRTDFYIGRKIVTKDRKAPFVHTQTVSAGATAGSTVTVRARAFIKVKRGRGPKKSISTTIRVCS